jgi:hypothetical protein
MRKSGSAKTNVPGSLFVAELEGLPDGRDIAVFARNREVEKPAE